MIPVHEWDMRVVSFMSIYLRGLILQNEWGKQVCVWISNYIDKVADW